MGVDATSLLYLHKALIRQVVAYSSPVLRGLSRSLELRLHHLLARSLRVCLGVPRAASGDLVFAKAREPPLAVLRQQETYRHFYRLTPQHFDHPLPCLLLTRTVSLLHFALTSSEAEVLSHTYWESDINCAPWLLPSPLVNTDVPGFHGRMNSAPVVAARLTLSYLHYSYRQHPQLSAFCSHVL